MVSWRAKHLVVEDDKVCAHWFTSFEEAYRKAGRVVSLSWVRALQLVDTELSNDAAHATKFAATIHKIRQVDGARAETARIRKSACAVSHGPSSSSRICKQTHAPEMPEEKKEYIDFFVPLSDVKPNL